MQYLKKISQGIFLIVLGIGIWPSASQADVCSTGVGVPPFLAAGVDPNLLLAIDNSGSMLDMAYSAENECVNDPDDAITDDDYDPTKSYAGYFEEDTWYKWRQGEYPAWQNDFAYTVNARVYSNGIIWVAEEVVAVSGKSDGTYPGDDQGITWRHLLKIDKWANGKGYTKGDIVRSGPQLYAALTTGTSDDGGVYKGLSLEDDIGVSWESVESTWSSIYNYAAGKIVSYKGSYYQAPAVGIANGGVYPGGEGSLWERLDEGSYTSDWDDYLPAGWQDVWENTNYSEGDVVKYLGAYYKALEDVPAADTAAEPPEVALPPNDVLAPWGKITQGGIANQYCQEAVADGTNDGNVYEKDGDVCISILSSPELDNDGNPTGNTIRADQVTAFTARGNLLNWVASSKFDVQKKILTGGKYNADVEQLVSEHRGCSGSRYIKQVKFDDNTNYLVMAVRGSRSDYDQPDLEDRVDSSDDTGRLEILGVTEGGYSTSTQCKAALDRILEKGLNGSQSFIKACTDTFPNTVDELGDQHPVLNHSLQFCWQLENHQRNLGNVISECEAIYTNPKGKLSQSYLPNELEPAYGAYICFGELDPALDHINRAGYVGRCWDAVGCYEVPMLSDADGGCDIADSETNCTYLTAETVPELYMNEDGKNYKCNTLDASAPSGCKEDGEDVAGDSEYWDLVAETPAGVVCNPDDDSTFTTGWENPGWAVDDNPKDNDPDHCILQASIDYCADLTVPETIDPTNDLNDTNQSWNIPGVLRDSEVWAQLGYNQPLLAMKGVIDIGNTPNGIIQRQADGIRMGAMAFNSIGAWTECTDTYRTGSVERYCPPDPLDNKDGAKLITEIKAGTLEYTEGTKTVLHAEKMARAINATRAISWTPLSEAMFTALGYFTQNDELCINEGTSGCEDLRLFNDDGTPMISSGGGPVYADDPVDAWCQENNIIIITEGESTADINYKVASAVQGNMADALITVEATDDTGGDDSNTDVATDVDLTTDSCSSLVGSTFFDDMTWWGQHVEPLYQVRKLGSPDFLQDKRPITTHIVTTSTLDNLTTTNVECNPKELMTRAATNGGKEMLEGDGDPSTLEKNLLAAILSIKNRVSAGSAASVVSSSRSGEGAIYQAVFWPEIPRNPPSDQDDPEEDPLAWVGDVHALFIDDRGYMWDDYSENAPTDDVLYSGSLGVGTLWSEDRDGDGVLYEEDDNGDGTIANVYDALGNITTFETEDLNGNGTLDGDRRVRYYFANNVSRLCFREPELVDGTLTCPASDYTNTPAGDGPEIRDFEHFLWSAEEGLEAVNRPDFNREHNLGKWDWENPASDLRRYIFTWNDLDNDGRVDETTEVLDLEEYGLTGDTSPAVNWSTLNTGSGLHHDILADFMVDDADEMNLFIRWLRGTDLLEEDGDGDGVIDEDFDGDTVFDTEPYYRCRKFPNCYDPDNPGVPADIADNPVWRLGDIIHSTPKLVAQPSEGFHTIYGDTSYARFVSQHRYRRHMIYFGAGDGNLHAVNGGFYEPKSNKFWKNFKRTNAGGTELERCWYDSGGSYPNTTVEPTLDYSCVASADNAPPLGTEMWSYIPYNLQPHLKGLTKLDYTNNHKFFVDKEPRIFDMQIFEPETTCSPVPDNGVLPDSCVHPEGWGTILVGALRFGGAPIDASDPPGLADDGTWEDDVNSANYDKRRFISTYFILDITDPEGPPRLLGELTIGDDTLDNVDMGFSTPMVTAAVMRNKYGETTWYLVFGNGPQTLTGENDNDEQGKLAVFPMSALNGSSWTGNPIAESNLDSDRAPFRFINDSGEATIFPIPITNLDINNDPTADSEIESFVSDMISVDLDLQTEKTDVGGLYKTDAVYFGTVDGDTFTTSTDADGNEITSWDGGGRIFRLVMRDVDTDNTTYSSHQIVTTPSEWKLKELINTGQPITGAPSVGWDGANYWIYFGTGRFFDRQDKTDDNVHHFFGVKEPLDDVCEMEWLPINWDPVWTEDDGSGVWEAKVNPDGNHGDRGLVRSDYILVPEFSQTGNEGLVYCSTDNGYSDPDDPVYDPDDLLYDPSLVYDPDPPGPGECDLSYLTNEVATGVYEFDTLIDYIAGTGTRDLINGYTDPFPLDDLNYPASQYTCNWDSTEGGVEGWFRELRAPRERVIGQSALLGGLLTFSTYQPFKDPCIPEGLSNLYGVHYQTGTAYYEDVFGLTGRATVGGYSSDDGKLYTVNDKVSLGRGLSTTPSMHTGKGSSSDAKAVIQTSTGEIIEIEQKNLPIQPPRTGRIFWNDDQNPAVLEP